MATKRNGSGTQPQLKIAKPSKITRLEVQKGGRTRAFDEAGPTTPGEVSLRPMRIGQMTLDICSYDSSKGYIAHQWDEKQRKAMREKTGGRKTKTREKRDPDSEAFAATYRDNEDRPGIPVLAIKGAMISAAHKDIGFEKVLVRKAIFVKSPDSSGVVPIQYSRMEVREDMVRVGNASADLRYRPEFMDWSATLDIEFDSELVTPSDVANLINRAGYGIGIGDWRPEKGPGNDFGRFMIAEGQQIAIGYPSDEVEE